MLEAECKSRIERYGPRNYLGLDAGTVEKAYEYTNIEGLGFRTYMLLKMSRVKLDKFDLSRLKSIAKRYNDAKLYYEVTGRNLGDPETPSPEFVFPPQPPKMPTPPPPPPPPPKKMLLPTQYGRENYFYAALSRTASFNDYKTLYRKASLEYHPDKCARLHPELTNEQCTEITKKLNSDYLAIKMRFGM
jgi:hypothetical protein